MIGIKKRIFLYLFCLCLLLNFGLLSQTVPTSTVSANQGGVTTLIRFVDKVWANPTVANLRTSFAANTNVRLMIIPRKPTGEVIEGKAKSYQKIVEGLMQVFYEAQRKEGAVIFYYNNKNQTAPFTVETTNSISCRFKPYQLDSAQTILNAAYLQGSIDVDNFTNANIVQSIINGANYCQRVLSKSPPCNGSPATFSAITLNTKPAKLLFYQAPYNTTPYASNGGVDVKQHDVYRNNYNEAIDEFDKSHLYQIPWKAVKPNQPEKLKFSIHIHGTLTDFNWSKLKFIDVKTKTTLNTNLNTTDSTITITASGYPQGSTIEVGAIYTKTIAPAPTATTTTITTETYMIGAFNMIVLDQELKNVVLVKLTSNTNYGNITDIEKTLNECYGRGIAKFNVSELSINLPVNINKNIHIESSGLLSNYMPDMKPIIEQVKQQLASRYNADTYYLVFGASNDGNLEGYMPRGRNIGFIFNTNDIGHTVAHELGHGVFNLKHIFDTEELGQGNKGQTNNLMDYNGSSPSEGSWKGALYKHQWDQIHNPDFVGWFEGDDDGAALKAQDGQEVFTWINKFKIAFGNNGVVMMNRKVYTKIEKVFLGGIDFDYIEVQGAYTGSMVPIYPKNKIVKELYSYNQIEEKYKTNSFGQLELVQELKTITVNCLSIDGGKFRIIVPNNRLDFLKLYLESPGVNKNLLLFVNGYRPILNRNGDGIEMVEYDNSTNKIEFGDIRGYWNGIDAKFMNRIGTRNAVYVDGHHHVVTSNHLSVVMFSAGMASSLLSYKYCSGKIPMPDSLFGIATLCTRKSFLHTKENTTGFLIRKNSGAIAANDLIAKINKGEVVFNKQTDTLDVVAHSMGYAYAVGMVNVLHSDSIKFGRFYILAPENACSDGNNWTWFKEVWQYGADEKNTPPYLQDGVAPQCLVKDLDRLPAKSGGRVYIPNDYEPKGFLDSHTVKNYDWIFNKGKNDAGYVKPRN